MIGEAIKYKRTVFTALGENHLDTYDASVRDKITKELVAVIASPICSNANDIPIVLAIDFISDKYIDLSGVLTNMVEFRALTQSWADELYEIIEL